MNRYYSLSACILLLALHSSVCAGQEIPSGHYFGQDPPGFTPEIFAPGVLSQDDRYEYCTIFSPNLDECVFGVTDAYWSTFTQLYTKMESDSTWIDPVPAPFQGNGDGLLASYSADGGEIYFASSRPVYPPANIWRSFREADSWSDPVSLDPPVNSASDEWGPTSTDDGTLYFCSFREGGYGAGDLYRTGTTLDREITVENLGPTINSAHNDASPHVARDGSYLIFESERPGGHGQADLYISFNEAGVWTDPRNLGPPINTDQIEDGPFVSPDGNYLFFNRREAWYTTEQTEIWWVDARAVFDPAASGLADENRSAREGILLQNAPNPFASSTAITYSIPSPGFVEITIYDIAGREVYDLMNAYQVAGTYSVNCNTPHGASPANGLYYYTLRVGGEMVATRRMVHLR